MKSTTKTEPWAKAQPYIMDASDAMRGAYDKNAGAIQSATDSITGLMPSMVQKYQQGDAGVNAARNYNVGVLSGQYLNGNPELDAVVGRSVNDTVNAGQAALGLKGLTGGSSYADILSRNAGSVASNLRYGDYNNERARMATAAGQAPGIAQADYLSIAPLLASLEAAQAPINAAGQYGVGVGGLLGNYNKTTQKQGALGTLMQMVASGAQAYATGGLG